MSILFEQKPVNSGDKVPVITNWNPVIGYMVIQDSSIAGFFYYKLILEIKINDNNGILLGKIKQRRNGYSPDINSDLARAFFDLKKIVNSQLTNTIFDQNITGQPFQTIHKLCANTGVGSTTSDYYSVSGDKRTDKTQITKIFVKAYQEYSTNANQVPTENTGSTATNTRFYLKASLPLLTQRDTDSLFIQGTAFQKYQTSSSSDLFLSDLIKQNSKYNSAKVYRTKIRDDDYHTVAFLNDNGNFDSEIDKIQIIYYDISGSALTITTITNSTTYGGYDPDSVNDDLDNDPYRLLYFGCGTANLEAGSNSVSRPSNASNNGWVRYTIQGLNSSNSARTDVYEFERDNCRIKGFKTRRLAWVNTVGGYDYFNFTCKSTEKLNVKRDTYSTLMGYYSSSKFFYNNTQRGKTVRTTEATLTETLKTDWISEEDAVLLQSLMKSNEVQVVQNTDTEFTQGVNVVDTNFTVKTKANDKLIQYTIQIEYANNINTNS